jgi:hypothetical protein
VVGRTGAGVRGFLVPAGSGDNRYISLRLPPSFILHGCRSHAVPATWLGQPCCSGLVRRIGSKAGAADGCCGRGEWVVRDTAGRTHWVVLKCTIRYRTLRGAR